MVPQGQHMVPYEGFLEPNLGLLVPYDGFLERYRTPGTILGAPGAIFGACGTTRGAYVTVSGVPGAP